jgi:hypothetical protein
MMKILFIYPRFVKYLENFPGVPFDGARPQQTYSYQPALGIPILMSLTPPEHECEFIDQNIEEIPWETDADLIALSFFTPQAGYAFEICTRFRELGKLVIAGGVHPTVCPEETSRYADILCLGEAEIIWPEILRDVQRGAWKKSYRQTDLTELETQPLPDRSAVYAKEDAYDMRLDFVEFSRGCNVRCNSCVVPVVQGRSFRFRGIDKVIEDVHSLRYPMVFITDDLPFIERNATMKKHLIELFGELERSNHGHGFMISTIPMQPVDRRMMALMARGGGTVAYSTFGFDPVSNSIMTGGSARSRRRVIDQIKVIQDTGMLFYAAFHVGFKDHTTVVRDNIMAFCEDANIRLAQFCLKVPWPGTRMWDELDEAGQIIHTDWKKYNGANVVFTPDNMSPDQLRDIFVDLWQQWSLRYHVLNARQHREVIDFRTPLLPQPNDGLQDMVTVHGNPN